jgi:LPPG:FO 2-phospho-L-lactate transferase
MTPTGTEAVVLAGGSGGAKLAAGMQELLGSELAVIANTGDDLEVLGVHVSPDPDLVTYWLCDAIDEERGWGIRGDTFTVFERLVELGAPDWFRLSDRDLATCLTRTRLLAEGARPTEAQAVIARGLGVRGRVLPMCDEPVRTRVRTPEGWRDFQRYMVLERAKPPVTEVVFEGVDDAAPSPEVTEALASAEAIVIGPSNPVVSIGPILAVPGMRDAISSSRAPVVAVSPFVAGQAIKGPTEPCMEAVGQPASAEGVAALYDGVIDALVVDSGDPEPPPERIRSVAIPTLMDGPAARRAVSERTLELVSSMAAA